MATFKFHASVGEIVPWQAQYVFPSQQTAVKKHIVKLPPKNGGTFEATNTIRIEFPSDNYCNMLNSVLALTLTTSNVTTTSTTIGIQASAGDQTVTFGASASATNSIYVGQILSVVDSSGERQTYQIEKYDGAGKVATLDRNIQSTITNGASITISPNVRLESGGAHNLIQRVQWKYGSLVLEDIPQYKTLVRALMNMGVDPSYGGTAGSVLEGTYAGHFQGENFIDGYSQAVQSISRPRTFCLNLATGIASIKKLVPLKWMASQLALEITLASDVEVFKVPSGSALAPKMSITNVNFIAEMLDFDTTYDAAFYMGIKQGGVPLKFSSWHYHNFQLNGSSSQLQIHERARSVKMALAVARDAGIQTYTNDSGRFYHDLGASQSNGILANAGQGSVQSYWWRIGNNYYPSQPVNCGQGGAEAYTELLKCVDALGDYQRGSGIDQASWSSEGVNGLGIVGGSGDKFCISGYFENTDVTPDGISGINAEEQSDLALQITADPTGTINKRLDVFVAYDSLLLVGDNNSVNLVL